VPKLCFGTPPAPEPPRQTASLSFDYGTLKPSDRKCVEDEACALRQLLAGGAADVVQIGRRLTIVRRLVGRNGFKAWRALEFRLSAGSASNYMRSAAAFGDVPCLGNFRATA